MGFTPGEMVADTRRSDPASNASNAHEQCAICAMCSSSAQGQWEGNRMHGHGKFSWQGAQSMSHTSHTSHEDVGSYIILRLRVRPDGRIYEGEYENDIKA